MKKSMFAMKETLFILEDMKTNRKSYKISSYVDNLPDSQFFSIVDGLIKYTNQNYYENIKM